MKAIRYIIAALFAPVLLTACADDDYKNIVKQGDPQIEVGAVGKTLMGDRLDVAVTCTDAKGTSLSTLKAELLFGGETVGQTTIRTKEAGSYPVQLDVPFLKYVPNGEATLRLTLQNVTTSTTIVDVPFDVERPHFAQLQFITSDSTVYQMTEQADYTYTTTIHVGENGFKGHFLTKDGRWAFGNGGAELALGQTTDLEFQTAEVGDVEVTFNSRDFTYGPTEDIPVIPFNLAAGESATRQLVQGNLYSFGGVIDGTYYIDPDFFEDNEDGTYTFLPISGTYTVTAYDAYGFVQCYAGTKDAPATLQEDGTGAIWIIGDEGINKPYLSSANNHGWWTGTEWDTPLAPIADKKYQITLTVGQQLNAGSDANFKFFGQPDWGTEFHGTDDTTGHYVLSTDNPWFRVNEGDGNIHLVDGVTLSDGETYQLTIDLTAGTDKGVLTVKKISGNSIDLTAGKTTVKLKKGTAYSLDGIDADYFVDYDFFQANSDGTYTFLPVSGTYTVTAYNDPKFVQVYPSDADGNVSTLQADGTGSIWVIGSDCVNKPDVTASNNAGWNTDIDKVICLAPIADKQYRVTLTVGQQLKATDLNFKFFGQAGWGTEFVGAGGDYMLSTDSSIIGVGDGNGHDNGNLYLLDGATLSDGETYQFTIDLTAGVQNGVLTIEKK